MRKRKTGVFLLATLFVLGAVTGCSGLHVQQEEEIQKVSGLEQFGDLAVIAREEGSGTRDVFVEKTGLLVEDESGTEIDSTTKDASVVMNAESVIAEVSKNKAAIGYVSMGSLADGEAGITVLSVNGVEATSANVQKDDYPLTRSLHLAYSGELSPVEQDFVNYIYSKGQLVVGENFTKVKKETSFLSDRSKGSIRITGSTTMSELMTKLAEEYQKINPRANITVAATDSTSGLTAAMQGSCDLAMSSRNLKDYESELLEDLVIAKDGVAVIVNQENPVTNLTCRQIKEIYSGVDQKWEQINE